MDTSGTTKSVSFSFHLFGENGSSLDLLIQMDEDTGRELRAQVEEREWETLVQHEEELQRSVVMEQRKRSRGSDAEQSFWVEAKRARRLQLRHVQLRGKGLPGLESQIEESLRIDARAHDAFCLKRLRKKVAGIKALRDYEVDVYRYGEYQDQWATELECDQLRHEGVEEIVRDVSPMGSPVDVAGAIDTLALQDEVAKWDE